MTRDDIQAAWFDEYGAAANSAATVVCGDCGEMAIGDGQPIEIVCLPCYERMREADRVE
jgi:formylmethanofuran dehydrogenase subunit E